MITELEFKQFIKVFLDSGKLININTFDSFLDDFDFTTSFHDCNINKIKGDIFEYITKYYYLMLDYETYLFKEIPVLLREKLKLGNIDYGIDLIYKNNDLWYGVQCKWRKISNKCIHKDLISGFIMEFKNTKLNNAVLFSNVNNKNNYHKNSELEWILRNDLKIIDNKFLEFILDDKKVIKTIEQPITQLRYYQKEAIAGLIKSKDSCKQVVMACGTGKSIVIFEYIKYIKSANKNKIVILLPSLQLISQFYKKLSLIMPKETILSICSQMDIANFTNDVNNKPLINERLKDLEDGSNLRFTTNKSIIDNKLKLKKLIILCTYQSSSLLKDQKFDLGIFDEAHKTVNGEMFGFALYDTNVKINERVFFTATPKYYIGDEKCMSMDNKEVYGNVQYEYSFKKAIKEKNILDFEIVTYKVPTNMADIITEKYIKRDKLNIKTEVLISAILLIQHIKENKQCNKILTYHNSVNNALEFKKTLNYVLDILKVNASVYTLSGKTRVKMRNKIFAEFEKDDNEISIMCSARVLNEGVDLPCINTIMFVDPRSSTIDVTQSIGRGIRLYKLQTKCSIIIPIHYDQIEEKHNYSEIIRILTAMVDIDGQIIEKFITKNDNNKIIIKNIDMSIIDTTDAINIKYSENDLIENLKVAILNSQYLGFEYKKALLFEYSDANEMAPNKKDTIHRGFNIYGFLTVRKGQINNTEDLLYKQLAENKYIKKSIDECLEKRKTKLTWEQWKEILILFYEEKGTYPYQTDKHEGINIGGWFHKQKTRITSSSDKLYEDLAINDDIKKVIDDYIIFYAKKTENNIEKLEWDGSRDLLFEFCDLPDSKLMSKTVYKSQNIGLWLSRQKDAIQSVDDELYIKLSKNNIVKASLDEYLISLAKKDGIPKLSWEHFKILLFKFCDTKEGVPELLEIYEQQKLGSWYFRQKKQIKTEQDSKYILLAQNIHVKKDLEYHIDPDKKWNESCNMLFELCNKHRECPTLKLCADDKNDKFIFNWYNDQKKKINSSDNEFYKKLSKNGYVKINLDKFLDKKK